MGAKPYAGHPTSKFDAQKEGEIQPRHGSRGIRAFDPARFIFFVRGRTGAQKCGSMTEWGRYPASYVHVRGATSFRDPSAQRKPRYRRLGPDPIWLFTGRLTAAENADR